MNITSVATFLLQPLLTVLQTKKLPQIKSAVAFYLKRKGSLNNINYKTLYLSSPPAALIIAFASIFEGSIV